MTKAVSFTWLNQLSYISALLQILSFNVAWK